MRASVGLLYCAAALLPIAAAASQQRSFVASTGSDAHACTLASPCRSFSAAIAQTNAGGEVVVLDSAGYGPVTIAKPVSLIAPPGIYAGISVASGDGITIDAMGATVVLRGLAINGIGGNIGVNVVQVGRLRIENCVISNMASNGVVIYSAGSEAMIVDTIVRDNAGTGIGVAADAAVVLDHVRSEHNASDGFYISPVAGNATAAITMSVLSFNGHNGASGSVSSGSGNLGVAVERTALVANAQDGVRLETFAGPLDATITRNLIERNALEGIDLLGQSGSGYLSATIVDNAIGNNGQGGIRCAGAGPYVTYPLVSRNSLHGPSYSFDIGPLCDFGTFQDNVGSSYMNGAAGYHGPF
jgi:hypothetical protein